MRIAIAGAGSIGCYVGGKLLTAGAAEVVLVGRPRLRDEIAAHGLTVKDFDRATTVPADKVTVVTEVSDPAVAACDAVLVCVKSAQTAEVGRELARVLRPDAVVASLQNGVRNADVLRGLLGSRRVLASIVSFNVVSRGKGVFHRAMSGPLMMEKVDETAPRALVKALADAGFPIEEHGDLAPHQWTKLVVNLNNAISALSGAPTQQLLLTPGYRKILGAVAREALAVLRAARIKPARLRGVPLGVMPVVMGLPTPIVKLVTRAQMKVDAEARSSMWEDLTRGRPTEVDYLNGEIVRLANASGIAAPINTKIVSLVHDAEKKGPGSPGHNPTTLWSLLQAP